MKNKGIILIFILVGIILVTTGIFFLFDNRVESNQPQNLEAVYRMLQLDNYKVSYYLSKKDQEGETSFLLPELDQLIDQKNGLFQFSMDSSSIVVDNQNDYMYVVSEEGSYSYPSNNTDVITTIFDLLKDKNYGEVEGQYVIYMTANDFVIYQNENNDVKQLLTTNSLDSIDGRIKALITVGDQELISEMVVSYFTKEKEEVMIHFVFSSHNQLEDLSISSLDE